MNKKIIVPVLLFMMFFSTAISLASSNSEEVLMSKSSATIYVDCEKVQLSQEPFVYNGTTYLPVRAVSDALGKQITYETSSKAIFIGSQPGQALYLTEELIPKQEFYGTIVKLDYVDKLKMLGNSYDTGFVVESGGVIEFQLDEKYEKLTMDMGITGRVASKAVIPVEIYRDGRLYDTYFLLGSDNSPKKIELSLKGIQSLKIQLDDWDEGTANVALGNPMITKMVSQ